MSNTPARVPYSWLQVGAPAPGGTSPAASASDVNRELQRIQRQQTGLFQPRAVVFGMGGSPSPYIVRATDWLILVDASGGAISITFPDAARLDGLHVSVVKTDASANAVTLTATISGVVNPVLRFQYSSMAIDAGQGVWYSTGDPSSVRLTYRVTTNGKYRVTTGGVYRVTTGRPLGGGP